jgi:hypothetical protein
LNEIAKQRRGRNQFHALDEKYQENAIEAMRERRDMQKPVKFTPPGVERKWKARDLVDIHWKLTGPDLQPPAESYNRIMSCIIGHANPYNGSCYPSHTTIAIETGYSVETVKRAIRWWCKHKFLETESRGLAKALAYHPQWDLFETFWLAVAEDIITQKETYRESPRPTSKVIKGTYGAGHTGRPTEPQSSITSKVEPHPLKRTELPSEDSAISNPPEGSLKKEAFKE